MLIPWRTILILLDIKDYFILTLLGIKNYLGSQSIEMISKHFSNRTAIRNSIPHIQKHKNYA